MNWLIFIALWASIGAACVPAALACEYTVVIVDDDMLVSEPAPYTARIEVDDRIKAIKESIK